MVWYRRSNRKRQIQPKQFYKIWDRKYESLCDYSDALILVTGDKAVDTNNDTHDAFKSCAAFSTCKTEINVFIGEANHISIAMPMYNLTEYGDNYSDTPGSLRQFKRDGPPANNAALAVNNGVFNSELFKYKAALAGKKHQITLIQIALQKIQR